MGNVLKEKKSEWGVRSAGKFISVVVI